MGNACKIACGPTPAYSETVTPTCVYIVANGYRQLRLGLTKSLDVELFMLRAQAAGNARHKRLRLVWFQELGSMRAAMARLSELTELSKKELAAFVDSVNPTWNDLRPETVAAGRPIAMSPADVALRQLVELAIRPEEDDPGLGGVGAVLSGWPDFPRPRSGSAAAPLPHNDQE